MKMVMIQTQTQTLFRFSFVTGFFSIPYFNANSPLYAEQIFFLRRAFKTTLAAQSVEEASYYCSGSAITLQINDIYIFFR